MENKKKTLGICAALVVVVVAVIILMFCFDNRDKTLVFQGDKSKIAKTEEQKQRLVIGTSDYIRTSQTYFSEDQSSSLTNALVYESLMKINGDLTIENVLAKSIEFSSDGLEAEVTLDKASFSDGSKLTAEDVKAAYLSILKNCEDGAYLEQCSNIKGAKDYISGASENIEGIEVEGEQKLSITFEKVAAWNMQAFTLPVFRKAEVEGEMALGTGPYKIDGYQHNESIRLVENDKSESNGVGYKQIVIKRISTLGLPEELAAYEIDAFLLPYRADLEDIKKAGYHNIYRLMDAENSNYFLLNLDDEFGSNASLRAAISKSIDRELLSQEFADEQVMNNGYLTASSDEVEILTRNVDEAKELVKKATEMKVRYYGATDVVAQLRLDGIKESLEEAGITVERGTENEHTMSYRQSSGGMALKDIEEAILETQEKEEYCNKIKSIYKENSSKWMQKIEEYYMEECFIIPYSTNLYHLVISCDVDSEAIRELVVNNY